MQMSVKFINLEKKLRLSVNAVLLVCGGGSSNGVSKEPEDFTLEADSLVTLTHCEPRDLGDPFSDSFGLKNFLILDKKTHP